MLVRPSPFWRSLLPGASPPEQRRGGQRRRREKRPMSEGQVRGLWAPQRRALTAGLVLTITFVASEALAVVTVMPVVVRDLGGLRLYGWVFSGFMLGSVIGIVAAGRQAGRGGGGAVGGLGRCGGVFSVFIGGSVIGIGAAGGQADRRGPAVPFVAGVVLFGSGLAIAGLAPSIAVLVAGRGLQGLGAGAVPAVAYA